MNTIKTTFILTISACIFFTSCDTKSEINKAQTVNSVLGDISYVEKFGVSPDRFTDEQTRIKTHLQYVEKLLRQKDITDLSIEIQKKRLAIIDLLHNYWMEGVFPVN
jgi:hypothetical protein